MGSNVEATVKRFIKALYDGVDCRKLQSILISCPKEDFMYWTDECGQDALHYAVLADNAEAVDCLLKLGYFYPPHEPKVNMYAHLAARLGYRTVLSIVLQHRPGDFRVVDQPLLLPPELISSHKIPKKPEMLMHGERRVSSQSITPFSATQSSSIGSKTLVMSEDLTVSGRRYSHRVEQGDSSMCLVRGMQDSLTGTSLVLPPGRSESAEKQHFHRPSRSEMASASTARRDSFPAKGKATRMSGYGRRNSSPEGSAIGVSFDSPDMDSLRPLERTPLEVAARCKHLDCVKTLLDMYVLPVHPELGSKGYLTLAALANSEMSLKLLLREQSVSGVPTPEQSHRKQSIPYSTSSKEDYKTAVEVCLHSVFPVCLEALLKIPLVDTWSVFKHVNYFHVLFNQPATTYQRLLALNRMPAMVELLIRMSHDVSARSPPRTYPLYTLINNAFCCTDFSFTDDFIICMKLLMHAGANPNFDEIKYGELQEGSLQPMIISFDIRPDFPSALHCVIECVELHKDKYRNRSQAIHLAEECVETLTARGADILQVGRLRDCGDLAGDVLFQLAKSSVSLGLERGLVRVLLRYGAQPQRKINGTYALNVYLDEVYRFLDNEKANILLVKVNKLNEEVSKMICLMCSHMSNTHIRDIRKIFKCNHRFTGLQTNMPGTDHKNQ